ncbi:MAG: metalloprotease PmbA [Pseudomonadales bacterium]|jgi:PmbA protein|nr:metalloprotease PmbA [Pseudomonadales bacterium]
MTQDVAEQIDDLRGSEAGLRREVQEILEEARRQGATAAEVGVSRSLGLTVTVRRGELETVEFTRDQGFGITVYVGHRKGTASTTDARPSAVQDTVQKALEIARHTAEDPAAGLADASLMATELPELDLFHPWSVEVADAEALARECERAALGTDRRITNSEGATLSTSQSCRAYGNSHGFVGSGCGTRHGVSVSVIASDAQGMQRDYWYTSSRVPAELESPEAVGRRAAERALARLGARPVDTNRVPVAFATEIAPGLIGSFLSAISGGALYRRASFLCDSLGTRLFPERVRIDERPLEPRGFGSAAFDGDGVATRPKAIVEAGRLVSYLLSAYSGRRLGMASTGNAGGVHNLYVSDDGMDLDRLLGHMGRGMLVTELMGQGFNAVTGDYSRGAAGFWIEDGAIAFPVQEVTVAGNLRDMLGGIVAVAADATRPANVHCGTLLIEGMTVAGK